MGRRCLTSSTTTISNSGGADVDLTHLAMTSSHQQLFSPDEIDHKQIQISGGNTATERLADASHSIDSVQVHLDSGNILADRLVDVANAVHAGLGLDWTATVVLVTFGVRACLLPLNILAARETFGCIQAKARSESCEAFDEVVAKSRSQTVVNQQRDLKDRFFGILKRESSSLARGNLSKDEDQSVLSAKWRRKMLEENNISVRLINFYASLKAQVGLQGAFYCLYRYDPSMYVLGQYTEPAILPLAASLVFLYSLWMPLGGTQAMVGMGRAEKNLMQLGALAVYPVLIHAPAPICLSLLATSAFTVFSNRYVMDRALPPSSPNMLPPHPTRQPARRFGEIGEMIEDADSQASKSSEPKLFGLVLNHANIASLVFLGGAFGNLFLMV